MAKFIVNNTTATPHPSIGIPEPGRWFSDTIADYFYRCVVEFIVELGVRPDVDAKLLWFDGAPRTEAIVLNRLNGRRCAEN